MKSQIHAQPVVRYGATVTAIFSVAPTPKGLNPSSEKYFQLMLVLTTVIKYVLHVCMLSSEDNY